MISKQHFKKDNHTLKFKGLVFNLSVLSGEMI